MTLYNDWNSYWNKESKFDLSREMEYHFKTRQPFYKLLSRCIKSLDSGSNGLKILEIGCASAIDSAILAKENKDSKFYCLDLYQPALELARKVAEELGALINLIKADASKTNFADGEFDIVFSQGVLEHFQDVSPLMKEQLRILKPGGILIIDVPQTYTLYTLHKRGKVKKGLWPYGWETQYSYQGLKKLGREYGLEPIDVCGHEHELHLLRRIITCDKFWNFLEKKWGHYFLVNIAVAFKKNKGRKRKCIKRLQNAGSAAILLWLRFLTWVNST